MAPLSPRLIKYLIINIKYYKLYIIKKIINKISESNTIPNKAPSKFIKFINIIPYKAPNKVKKANINNSSERYKFYL